MDDIFGSWSNPERHASISELSLIEDFIPLPVDQRVRSEDIDKLLSLIY